MIMAAVVIAFAALPAHAQTTLPFNETFDGSLGAFSQQSLSGDNVWEPADGGAQMNGFGDPSGNASDDWLITPALDFTGTSSETLSFQATKGFDGPDLEVQISDSYSGAGAPDPANWTQVTTIASGGNKSSIDLSSAGGNSVYVAFRYISTGTGGGDAAQWTVDDVTISGTSTSPIVQFAVGSATVAENDGTAAVDVEIESPDGNEVTVDIALDTGNSTADASDFGSFTTSVTFPATASTGDTQPVTIPLTDDSQAEKEEVGRFVLQNLTSSGAATIGTQDTYDLTVTDDDVSVIFSEVFNGSLGQFSEESVSGDNVWEPADGGAQMNGFGDPSGNASDDWLITPALNLAVTTVETFSFETAKNFSGPDLEVKLSTDYSGSGDPTGATWTDLTTVSTANTFSIDLSDAAFDDSEAYVAFRYTSTGTGGGDAAQWTVDNVELTGGVNAPTVQFAAASGTVSEGDGSTDLTVSIANPDGTAVDVEVAFAPGSSTADTGDIGSYATQTVSFPASASDGDTQTVPVTLTDDSEVEGDETASFTLQNLTTSGGAILGSPQAFDLTIEDNDASPLVINEILADPPSDAEDSTVGDANGDGSRDGSEDEFIEIYNSASTPLDLSGYTIEDGFGLRHAIPSGTTLDPGVALIVFGGGTPASSIPGVVQTASDGQLGLNNGGDTVTLKNASGGTIAEVTYGSEGGDDQSLVRSPEFTGPFVGHTAVSADSFSPGRQVDGTPLPVELTGFTATRSGESVTLQWTTASETNNAGFEVQRADANAPSENAWSVLAFVEGAGTTDEPQSYAFTAENMPVGTHRFRLRQVDTGGTESFSEPVEVDVTLDKAYQLSQAYPNPVRSQATLDLTVQEAQPVTATVYDLLGRQVETLHSGDLAANTPTELRLSAGGLSSGTYFVRVEGESFTATRRLTVVR